MTDIIINVSTLPEPLCDRIPCDKVRVSEHDGIFTLIPVQDKLEQTDMLFGMFADSKISTDEFFAQKQTDKELER